MAIHVLPGDVRIEPPLPVEIPVSVDGTTMRIAIDWNAVVRTLPPGAPTVDSVAEALRKQRPVLEMAIRAHLAAHGVPLDHRVSLSAADIDDAAHH
jgi:hypothetical protein